MSNAFTTIPQLVTEVNDVAGKVGWNDAEVQSQFDGKLMLIVSEAAEALEWWRAGKEPPEFHYEMVWNAQTEIDHPWAVPMMERVRKQGVDSLRDTQRIRLLSVGILKPRSIPDELADIIIRTLHVVSQTDVDIVRAIREKMLYNRSREWRHGGKRT